MKKNIFGNYYCELTCGLKKIQLETQTTKNIQDYSRPRALRNLASLKIMEDRGNFFNTEDRDIRFIKVCQFFINVVRVKFWCWYKKISLLCSY